MNKILMLQLLMGDVQVLCAKVDMWVVLFASIPRSIICPWHDAKAKQRLPPCGSLVRVK